MKSVAVLAAVAGVVSATPLVKRAPTDEQILNYALTLEHLESAFYSGAVAKFDNATFASVNADRGRFAEIAEHEASHVSFLSGALGSSATQACNYSFPYTDVTSFVALASVLESVGVSAYLGAAGYISNPTYLTAAASILTTEARHQEYVAYVVGNAPWSGAYDTPQGLDQIYSLAAPFITGCPSSNPSLPVKAFPSLNITSNSTTSRAHVYSPAAALASNSSSNATHYVVFFNGLSVTAAPIASNNTVEIPESYNGTVFAVVTNQNTTNVTDANTIAGPAIIQLYQRLDVAGGSGGPGSGQLNTTEPGTGGTVSGNGNSSSSGSNGGSSGGHSGAFATVAGVQGMTVAAGLLVSGLAAVLL